MKLGPSSVLNTMVVRWIVAGVLLTMLSAYGSVLPFPVLAAQPENIPGVSPPLSSPSWVPPVPGIPKYGHCVRILSIDGGGIRGIIPALLLNDLEGRTGARIANLFDLMVGTSTGGILALGLSKPDPSSREHPQYTARQLVELYESHGEKIFPGGSGKVSKVRGVFAPRYSPSGLETVLTRYFANTKLGEALTNVKIPAYEIEER